MSNPEGIAIDKDTMETEARIADNPFYVLGLPPTCARAEIEREGQKLIGMLELELSQAQSYQTPLGPRPRTVEKVRAAMAELRDPEKRLVHELWARLPAEALPEAAPDGDSERARPWAEAAIALGWSPYEGRGRRRRSPWRAR